jgi:hypothetical protein
MGSQYRHQNTDRKGREGKGREGKESQQKCLSFNVFDDITMTYSVSTLHKFCILHPKYRKISITDISFLRIKSRKSEINEFYDKIFDGETFSGSNSI